MFECYHNQRRSTSATLPGRAEGHSQGEGHAPTCELSFLLRPCILRRAVEETGSELGLMLEDQGREKITVEALTTEEMGPWVQVLLTETSTPSVPDGLQQFLGEWQLSQSDSGGVLQQWGLDNFVTSSSHEYEDPQETVDMMGSSYKNNKNNNVVNTGCEREKVAEESISRDSTLVLSTSLTGGEADSADLTLVRNSLEGDTEELEASTSSQAADPSSAVVSLLPNVCRTTPGTKNTDSGCYSGQGANSDSDSGCEHSSSVRGETMDPDDAGYATLDSVQKSVQQETRNALSEKEVESPASNVLCEKECAISTLCDSSIGSTVTYTNSADVSPETVCRGQAAIPQPQYPSTVVTPSVPVTSSPSASQCQAIRPASLLASSPASDQSSSPIPSHVPCASLSNTQQNPATPMTQPSTGHSPCSLRRHSSNPNVPTVLTSSGEEYSLVIKRPDRHSTRSSKGSSTTTLTSRSSITSHNHSSSSVLDLEQTRTSTSKRASHTNTKEETVNASSYGEGEEEDNVFQNIMVVGSGDCANVKIFSGDGDDAKIRAEMEHALSLSCNNNNESYYEPVGGLNTAAVDQTEHKGIPLSPPSPDGQHTMLNSSLDSEHSGRDLGERSCQSSISSISSRLEHGASHSHLEPPDLDSCNNSPLSSSPLPLGESPVSSAGNVTDSCLIRTEVSAESNDVSKNTTQSDSNVTETTDKMTLRVTIPAPSHLDDLKPDSPGDLPPISPSSNLVSSLTDNPATTSEELQHAMERLKEKQVQIRRKRMAVHDKRQRVDSDEKRLACEKEMAALEKLGENLDSDIRVLQNHLAVLQGESLDALCGAAAKPQGQSQGQGQAKRNKSGSRRKKQKRKS